MGSHDPLGSQVTAGAGRGDSGHRVEAELCCAGGRSHWHVQGRGLRLRPHLPQKARRRDRWTYRQIEGMNGETIRQIEHRKGDEIKMETTDREKQRLESGLANDLGSCRLRLLRRAHARL